MFDSIATGKWWDIGRDIVPGCTPVSPACLNCWSAEKTHRAGCQKNPKIQARYAGLTDAQGSFTGEVRPQWQDLPKIGRARKPSVYTFWNDLFHPGVPDGFIESVLQRICESFWLPLNRNHFFIICTKRPERAHQFIVSLQNELTDIALQILSRRLLLMTTAENQHYADIRLPQLLQIPGVLHGVSVEPCLGPVDLKAYLGHPFRAGDPEYGWEDQCSHLVFTGGEYRHCGYPPVAKRHKKYFLDFIATGGETGPHARPSHPDWFRRLRDDCQAAGVPFFFKGWGEWAPVCDYYEEDDEIRDPALNEIGHKNIILKPNGYEHHIDIDFQPSPGCWIMRKTKAAGRLLDGIEWNGVPQL